MTTEYKGMAAMSDKRFLFGGLAAFGAVVIGFTLQGLMASPARDSAEYGNANAFMCDVRSVHDGDTFRCADGRRIRLNAINARELDGSCGTGHPCPRGSAEAARDVLTRAALGQRLSCVSTGSSYSRTTAWCARDDGVDLSCFMVRSGMAAVWSRYDPTGRLRRCH